jgi:hypothetical protein
LEGTSDAPKLGITFNDVKDAKDADIRIAYQFPKLNKQGNLVPDRGSWSYVGTDARLETDLTKPTVNFGWDLQQQPWTALHELGHVLGLEHEHSSPVDGGPEFEPSKLLAHLNATQPIEWTMPMVYSQIIKRLKVTTYLNGTDYDIHSIMHYPFPAHVFKNSAAAIAVNKNLSSRDRECAAAMYPLPGKVAQKKSVKNIFELKMTQIMKRLAARGIVAATDLAPSALDELHKQIDKSLNDEPVTLPGPLVGKQTNYVNKGNVINAHKVELKQDYKD